MTSRLRGLGRNRWVALALTLAVLLGLALLGGGTGGPTGLVPRPLVVNVVGQVTTSEAAPTTAAPTTVRPTLPQTTDAPTTQRPTTEPTTATTRALPTTTVALPTTTVPAESSDGKGLTILLILLAIAAVVAAIAVILGMRNSKKKATTNWQGEVRGALVDVDLTIDVAGRHSQTPDPRPFGQVITPRLQNLRSRLETVAAKAPSQELGQKVHAIAVGLQSYGLAAEAEWMLRAGTTPPTAEQLNQAGSASYERRAALEQSVSAVRAEIGDPTATAS
jgi:hypothetical protein